MATSPSFMNFLTQSGTGGVTQTQKKNPYAQTATTAPTPGNSPVTPTGQVNPNPPPRPQQSASILAAARVQDNGKHSAGGSGVAPTQAQLAATRDQGPATAAQTTLPGAPGPGWFRGPDGGWLPPDRATGPNAVAGGGATGGTGSSGTGTIPNMPAYAQHFAGVTPYQGTAFTPAQNITYDPTQLSVTLPEQYGTYNPYQVQTQLPTQGYQAGNFGTTPFTQYRGDPNSITQFSGPQTQAIQAQEQQLLSQMLANPYSMSAQNVAQLKEKQKETALALQNSGMSRNAELAAAQGRTGSGNQALQDAILQDQAQRGILTGYRDIDLNKMKQDRLDLIDALGAADTSLNSASNRATSEFTQQLAGQQAREKVGLDSATSAQAAERLGLDRTTAQEDARYNQAKSAQDLAALGLDADTLRQRENQFGFAAEQQRYRDALAGLGLQTDVAQFNAGENFRGYQSADTNRQAALTQQIAQAQDRQAAAQSGMTLAGMLQSGWDADQARQLQAQLGNRGLDIDATKIGSNEKIAKMDNSTRLLDILLGNQLGRAQLGQQGAQFNAELGQRGSQFNKTFGLQQQGMDNQLMQWLLGNI